METASIIQQVRGSTRPPARCAKRSKQPAEKRATGFGRNGFLKYRFQPLKGYYVKNWQKAEKEFFISLSNLCKFYSINVPDVTNLLFPANIQSAYTQIVEKFKSNGLECKIMQDENHDACLATAKTFDTGYRLYYIPIKPVCKLGSCDETKQLGALMLAIYQYLYQTVSVTYYRQPGYMNFIYETIENWINEDNDGEDENYRKYQLEEFDKMKTFGDSFFRILKQPFKVEMLTLALNAYRGSNAWDFDADALAQEIIKLANDYPKRSIKQSIPYGYYQTGENDLICLEHYLSFYWSGNDGFTELIDDMVNNELQEMGYQEEPVAVQWFDKPQRIENHDFDFESRLFALIDNLIDLVNEYDNEKHK